MKAFINTIFYGRNGEIIRYLFFGVLNVVVTWTTYALCVLGGLDPTTSNVISWIIGVTFAFVVNKLYVFYSHTTKKKTVGREAASFIIGRLITGAIALIGFPVLYNLGLDQSLFGIDGFFVKIITTVIETVMNYFFSKYLVFHSTAYTEDEESENCA